jgi:hypothetical protein
MSVAFHYVGDAISVLVVRDGKSIVKSVRKDNPAFPNVLAALSKGDEAILEALDMKEAVRKNSGGRVTIEGSTVMYDGHPLHDNLTAKIIEYVSQNIPYVGLLKFLENLMDNTSFKTRQHLYNFLANKGVPITPDGYFLALKAVRGDWLDKWTGKISNEIGQVVKMDRKFINDDESVACAPGLHCGASEYVNRYGSQQSGDRIVVVKVNPRDVVAVPKDHQMMKMRVSEYEVVAEGQFDQQLLDGLYSAENGSVAPMVSHVGDTIDDAEYVEEDEIDDFSDEDTSYGSENDWETEEDFDDEDEEEDSWVEFDEAEESYDEDDNDQEDSWVEDEEGFEEDFDSAPDEEEDSDNLYNEDEEEEEWLDEDEANQPDDDKEARRRYW